MQPLSTDEKQTRQWAMFLHLSLLAVLLLPLVGYVLPIALWQFKKNELPGIEAHGKVVVNWLLSTIIYSIVGIVVGVILVIICAFVFSNYSLFFTEILSVPLLGILASLNLLYPIIGGIKANNGIVWPYPLSIRFFK